MDGSPLIDTPCDFRIESAGRDPDPVTEVHRAGTFGVSGAIGSCTQVRSPMAVTTRRAQTGR